MNISQYIFGRTVRKQQRTVKYHSYAQSRNILILFESELQERHTQIKQLIKELQKEGKEVTAWGYVDKKQAVTAVLRDFRVLDKQSFGLFHRPKKALIEELDKMHFDLLIDLNTNPELLELRYLTLLANADLKTGLACYKEPYIHDMMISLPDEKSDTIMLFDQILHYLKTIN